MRHPRNVVVISSALIILILVTLSPGCLPAVVRADTDNAKFASLTLPDKMSPGEVRRVSIIVQNTGSSTWSESVLIRLGAGSTNEFVWSNWAYGGYSNSLTDQRACISGSVAPGSNTTFTFDIKAPSTTGTHWFEARMVRDGVAWFGDVLSKAIEVQNPSMVTISGTVSSSVTGNPRIEGIWVYFWRHDGYAFYAQTGVDGRYSAQVDRSNNSNMWYNIHANKDNKDPAHPKNPNFNDIVVNNVIPDQDRTVDFLLTLVGQPPTPPSDLFGLCINANYGETNPSDSEFTALGVSWVRTIKYNGIEIVPHGNVKWLVIFNSESIPRNAGESWSNYVTRFSDTVRDTVKSHTWISAIEVWNEEDLPNTYLSPQDYAPLLKAIYKKVKALPNPPTVIFGGLASGGSSAANYVNQVKQQWGGNIYFDAVGLHPYLATAGGIGWPSRGTMQDTINTVYAASSRRQIWVTEFGAAYQHLGNDKLQQAQYLENCYKLFEALKDGTKRKVGVAFWFAWDDRTHYNPNAESFGLVEQDRSGSPDQWRRPAWYAYQRNSHPGG